MLVDTCLIYQWRSGLSYCAGKTQWMTADRKALVVSCHAEINIKVICALYSTLLLAPLGRPQQSQSNIYLWSVKPSLFSANTISCNGNEQCAPSLSNIEPSLNLTFTQPGSRLCSLSISNFRPRHSPVFITTKVYHKHSVRQARVGNEKARAAKKYPFFSINTAKEVSVIIFYSQKSYQLTV